MTPILKKQKPECGKCLFYRQLTDWHGECRFNAPIVAIKQPDNKEFPFTESVWPKTAPLDWYGQFKEKQK